MAGTQRLYELRLYTPYAGRMPDLLRRFREELPALFERHGIDRRGTWLTQEEAPRLAYLTAYTGPAERDAAWAAFGADPQWQAVRRDSNAGAEMLQGYELHLLKPRPDIDLPLRPEGDVHELVFLPTQHGREVEVTDWLRDTLVPQLQSMGASLVSCFDLTSGIGLPQSVLMIAWPVKPAEHRRGAVRGAVLPADLAPLHASPDAARRIALDPV